MAVDKEAQRYNAIIRENLNRLLREKNVTQGECARALGVAASTVSSWVSGGKTPRMKAIDKLCRYFDVDRAAILTSQNERAVELEGLTNEEGVLIDNYRKLDADQKSAIQMVTAAFMAQRAAVTVLGNVVKATHGNAFFTVNGSGTQSVDLTPKESSEQGRR